MTTAGSTMNRNRSNPSAGGQCGTSPNNPNPIAAPSVIPQREATLIRVEIAGRRSSVISATIRALTTPETATAFANSTGSGMGFLLF